MRRSLIPLVSLSFVAAYSSFAQDQSAASDPAACENPQATTENQAGTAANEQGVITNENVQPGTAENAAPVSVAQAPAPTAKKTLRDEKIGFKPQVGDLNYRDATSARSNRALYGGTVDFNFGSFVSEAMNPGGTSGLFLGPSTGFFYSHIGAVGGNFFGSNGSGFTSSAENDQAGANLFLVPADLKAGWTWENFRLAVHGGGNVIYRSVANSVQVGTNTPTGHSGSKWGILPNAGASLEYGILNGGAIILRPDWTFGGSNTMFAGTIGLSFPIG